MFWGLSEAANKLDTLVAAPAVCAVKTLQPCCGIRYVKHAVVTAMIFLSLAAL